MATRVKSQKGLLIDITRCIGCNECSKRCKEVNGLPEEVDEKLTSDTWTFVAHKADEVHVRQLCRHCDEPACASVCPVGALHKTEEHGAIVYDKSICLGCRYCMIACPFDVPTFEWHSYDPRIRKCILCEPRLREGKIPGCAEACPTDATLYGTKQELLEIARARLAKYPDRYEQHIFGENEVGGTAVMFLSPSPFAELDFRTNLQYEPLPDLTWQALKHVPSIVAIGAGFLATSYWLFKRREEVEAHEGAGAKKGQSEEAKNA
jgi:formate dehydrogenase iron-sulfur subunit